VDAVLFEPLRAVPERSALLFDVDGTLAPIAPRPELARVPDQTRAELARLTRAYLLVACLSGRPGTEAARIVGVEGIRYVGNHGLELAEDAVSLARKIAGFRASIEGKWPIEDKGLSLSLHYREAPHEAEAVAVLDEIARNALAAGLVARWGRKVLEIRPDSAHDKGTAVRTLVMDAGARLGLYAGDDATDLDAFRGLASLGLERAVRIAVASTEGPSALTEEADAIVESPDELALLLQEL
jgi:trehalose 6-phosphate phosphatase